MSAAFYRWVSRIGWRIVMFGDSGQERCYRHTTGRYENFLNDEYQNIGIR